MKKLETYLKFNENKLYVKNNTEDIDQENKYEINIDGEIDKGSPNSYVKGYLEDYEDKLDYAIQFADFTNINKYIDLVDINIQDDEVGQTFMTTVLKIQNISISRKIKLVKLLLSRGYDVNLKNIHGQTSLYYTYNVKIAKLFVDAGIDLESRDYRGDTYYEYILWYKYKSIIPLIEYFMSIGIEYDLNQVLFRVSIKHDIKKIIFFTNLGADWNYKKNNKYFIDNLTKKEIIELYKELPKKFKGIFRKYAVNITRNKFNI